MDVIFSQPYYSHIVHSIYQSLLAFSASRKVIPTYYSSDHNTCHNIDRSTCRNTCRSICHNTDRNIDHNKRRSNPRTSYDRSDEASRVPFSSQFQLDRNQPTLYIGHQVQALYLSKAQDSRAAWYNLWYRMVCEYSWKVVLCMSSWIVTWWDDGVDGGQTWGTDFDARLTFLVHLTNWNGILPSWYNVEHSRWRSAVPAGLSIWQGWQVRLFRNDARLCQ